ncbi:MAG TPA: hypothetical protein VF771_06325 [Longimicrobiaceae bacterium]
MSTTVAPTRPAAVLTGAQAQQQAQVFARGLALALKEPSVRGLLIRAMRDSRFNEHKLVLQDFAGTPAGGQMVRAIAAANGVSEEVVRGWIGSLPPLDFYVPWAEHRQTWTGTADVVVASNLDPDQPLFTGYAPDGSATQFDARAGVPKPAVVYLHAAEPKGVRQQATTHNPNLATISDPDEPIYTVMTISPTDPEPTLLTQPVATYYGRLYSFKNYIGDAVGGIELLVKHYAGLGGPKISDEVMSEGFFGDGITYPDRQMQFATYGDTWIKVYEQDSGLDEPSKDDFWGDGKFGGFNVKHRFFIGGSVQWLTVNDACYDSPFAASYCTQNPSVDIIYHTENNPPPSGTGGFPSGDLANFTIYNSASAWSIQNGYLTAGSNVLQSIALRNGVTVSDGWVETETDQALDGGLVLRSQNNAGNHYLLAIRDDGRYSAANLQIYKAVNGTYTALTGQIDKSFARGTNHKIRFEASGTTLKAYWDGTLVATVTDATFSSGLIGLRANNQNSGTTNQTRYAVLRWNAVNPTDPFNDSGSLSNYTFVNTPEAWSVQSGFLYADANARQAVALRNGVSLVNGWVETTTDQVADGGLVLRAQDGNNYYLLAIRDDSRYPYANLEIYVQLNGSFTPLTQQYDISFPVGSAKTIRFEASGTTLKGYVDGVLVAQATDATYSSGLVGLRANGRDGETLTSRFDVFRYSAQ